MAKALNKEKVWQSLKFSVFADFFISGLFFLSMNNLKT
jgi:hypothetical protein